jgi:hypothetical protein
MLGNGRLLTQLLCPTQFLLCPAADDYHLATQRSKEAPHTITVMAATVIKRKLSVIEGRKKDIEHEHVNKHQKVKKAKDSSDLFGSDEEKIT